MKYIISLLFFIVAHISSAQISFESGSVQLESDLNTINAGANLDFGAFKTDLSISYNVSEKKLDYMHGELNMAAGEIYLALEISKLSKTSIDGVIQTHQMHKNKGWGYVARQLGIKPGSEEFHQLKNNSKNKASNHKHPKAKGKSKGKSKKKA
ncbi:hypothetical protein [Carboxylicivirga marina]|uniref:Uncharacterized protein n=1 Tax=Carboxylicivirga marina TaxID=2800988 RepID=A0ABS1HII8_9BACT|nr:hypothetical protein [Carboxylicivirga marina]MBK3517024.1 hypothetical protein [Carboxylicivirga marina]